MVNSIRGDVSIPLAIIQRASAREKVHYGELATSFPKNQLLANRVPNRER